jgi:serine protease inhibitor
MSEPQAEVQAVSSVAPINAWAAKVTNGMISQAVPPNTEFNCIITNAVYFKGRQGTALQIAT